ncbi:MAG: hypothetical protein Q9220_001248 [cf. Caloplaca sp. 1 TL-2023]
MPYFGPVHHHQVDTSMPASHLPPSATPLQYSFVGDLANGTVDYPFNFTVPLPGQVSFYEAYDQPAAIVSSTSLAPTPGYPGVYNMVQQPMASTPIPFAITTVQPPAFGPQAAPTPTTTTITNTTTATTTITATTTSTSTSTSTTPPSRKRRCPSETTTTAPPSRKRRCPSKTASTTPSPKKPRGRPRKDTSTPAPAPGTDQFCNETPATMQPTADHKYLKPHGREGFRDHEREIEGLNTQGMSEEEKRRANGNVSRNRKGEEIK